MNKSYLVMLDNPFMHYWIQFAHILLRIFASIFMRCRSVVFLSHNMFTSFLY